MLQFTPRELLGQEVHGEDGGVLGKIRAVSLVEDAERAEAAPLPRKSGRPKLAIADRTKDKVWIKKGRTDLLARVSDIVFRDGVLVLKGPAKELEPSDL